MKYKDYVDGSLNTSLCIFVTKMRLYGEKLTIISFYAPEDNKLEHFDSEINEVIKTLPQNRSIIILATNNEPGNGIIMKLS